MLKFLIITMIVFKHSNAVNGDQDQKKIDFWTNSIDEILIHFRYNKFTHELEMSQGSSEESQEFLEDTQNFKGKSNHQTTKNPLEISQNSENESQKPSEGRQNGNDRTLKSQNKSITHKHNVSSMSEKQNKSEDIKPLAKSVSSISENDDDSITAVKDDFIDIDLHKGLQSIDLSAVRMKLPLQRELLSEQHYHNLSIDSCAYNCSGGPHIACGHNWTFSPQCSHNAKLINLNNLQSVIIQQHNTLRNKLAGHLTQFEPAVRMATTQWHSELATYAQLNAMSCSDEHDFCHNTKEFKKTGQNLASHKWSGRKKDLSTIITQMISDWYSENSYAEQSDLDKFHRITDFNNEFIAHFTNIINERNTHVGCAAVVEKRGRWNTIHFTCNYARNNVFKSPIYEKGPTASKCLTGVNPEYQNLCSVSEVYE